MSGRSTDTCHKTRVENCKGNLADPRDQYGKWAYWCKDIKFRVRGWRAEPCPHQYKIQAKRRRVDKIKHHKSPEGTEDHSLASITKLFLYECPGGMAENKKRDEFLRCAERNEKHKRPRFEVMQNLIRAAFFQGQHQGRAQAAQAIELLN